MALAWKHARETQIRIGMASGPTSPACAMPLACHPLAALGEGVLGDRQTGQGERGYPCVLEAGNGARPAGWARGWSLQPGPRNRRRPGLSSGTSRLAGVYSPQFLLDEATYDMRRALAPCPRDRRRRGLTEMLCLVLNLRAATSSRQRPSPAPTKDSRSPTTIAARPYAFDAPLEAEHVATKASQEEQAQRTDARRRRGPGCASGSPRPRGHASEPVVRIGLGRHRRGSSQAAGRSSTRRTGSRTTSKASSFASPRTRHRRRRRSAACATSFTTSTRVASRTLPRRARRSRPVRHGPGARVC